jgi:hypothetical protein
MTELITQNPIVAFILTVASVVAVAWKVLHELFVKPRDFRIDLLSEDVARLTRQLESREVRVIAGQGHADESSQIEARPTDSKPLEKAPLPIAQSTQGSKTPADSLAVFYERWSDPSITKLQKQKFERDWTGKDVRWIVSVDAVSEASHGNILVSARDGAADKFSAPRAMLRFSDKPFAEMLLSLQPGDQIVVTGKIRDFFLSPTLDALTIDRA